MVLLVLFNNSAPRLPNFLVEEILDFLVSPFPVSLSCLSAVGYALSTILIDSPRCGECSFISPNRFSLLFGLLSLFFYDHEAVSIH